MAGWNEAAHLREPAGSSTGGQFAAGATGSTPTNEAPVQEGQSGAAVKQLQKRLNELGISDPPLPVDGKFGPEVTATVKAFQRSRGLKVDGLVGPKTTAALRIKVKLPKAAAAARHNAESLEAQHEHLKRSGYYQGRRHQILPRDEAEIAEAWAEVRRLERDGTP